VDTFDWPDVGDCTRSGWFLLKTVGNHFQHLVLMWPLLDTGSVVQSLSCESFALTLVIEMASVKGLWIYLLFYVVDMLWIQLHKFYLT